MSAHAHLPDGARGPSADLQALIDRYFDGGLEPAEEERLGRLVAADGDVALAVARTALFVDRLHGILAAESGAASTGPALRSRPAIRRAIVALAALVAVVLVAAWLRHPSATAAAAGMALDRIVSATAAARDREYRIEVLDHGPDGPPPPVISGGRGRKPGIDGARLFVRGSDRFVLIRRYGDGSEFVTGSDGTIGWAVPPKGRVHLSRDARRFRRAVPGEHEEVPFIDLGAGLDALRRGYDLAVEEGEDGSRTLRAVGRPGRRGPRGVDVSFDTAGVATRIVIDGIPADEGSPRSIALELVSQREVGEDFFGHAAHHAVDRATDWE